VKPFEPSGSIIAKVELHLDLADFAEILDEALEVLNKEAEGMPGFIAAEILVSADRTAIMILTEWTDRHAWGRSRYDERVGRMLEHCTIKSNRIEYEIYVRRGRFASTPQKGPHTAIA
jgi:heme-degrading monooxygenase HmoA